MQLIYTPACCRGNYISGFDTGHEVIIDFDVPKGATVLDLPHTGACAVDKPQERRGGQVLPALCTTEKVVHNVKERVKVVVGGVIAVTLLLMKFDPN